MRTHVSPARLWPIALLCLAFGLRVYDLGGPSLWYDEGYSMQFVARSWLDVLIDAPRLELNMPLHYAALKGWLQLTGNSEFAGRLLSTFAGMIAVAVAARIAGRPGFAGMAFVAISAVCIHSSREVRMYALAAALCALAAWCWQRALNRPGGRAWAWWSLAAVGSVLAHVLCAIPCAVQIALTAWHLTRARAPWHTWRPFLVVAVFTSAIVLGLGAFSLSFARDYGTNFSGMLNAWTTLRDGMAAQLLPRALPESLRLASFLALATLAAAILWRARPAQRQVLAMALLSLVGIVGFSVITGKFAPRYASLVTPVLLAAAGGAPGPGAARALRQAPRLALLGLLIPAWFLWRSLPVYANEDYRAAVAHLRNAVQADEAVLVVPGHLAPVFQYYYGPGEWTGIPPDAVLDVRNALDFPGTNRMLNQALSGKRGAWILAFEDDVIDPSHVVLTLLRRQAHLLAPSSEVRQFNGPRLIHFRFDAPYAPVPENMPPLASSIDNSGAQRGLGALGCSQLRRPSAGDALMEVACFWQIQRNSGLPYDTKVSLRLSDLSGARLAQVDLQLAADGLPYFPYDKPLTAIYYLPLPRDTRPGEYALQAVPYTGQGEMAPTITTRVSVNP